MRRRPLHGRGGISNQYNQRYHVFCYGYDAAFFVLTTRRPSIVYGVESAKTPQNLPHLFGGIWYNHAKVLPIRRENP